MAPQDMLDDSEPKARTLGPATTRPFDAVKALGEPRQVLGRDAGSLVADRDAHAGPACRRAGIGGGRRARARPVAGPESAGAAASGSASMRTRVPWPPYLIALSIRLTKSWCS